MQRCTCPYQTLVGAGKRLAVSLIEAFSRWKAPALAASLRSEVQPEPYTAPWHQKSMLNLRFVQCCHRQLSAGAELSRMRTVKLPTITKESASADFSRLLVAGGKAENVNFLPGFGPASQCDRQFGGNPL